MPVYFAITRDGVQFDGCVALNENNASAIIKRRYMRTDKHFVGNRERTTEDLLGGMHLEHVHISEGAHLAIERCAEEEAAVAAGRTLKRLIGAIQNCKWA